MKKSSYSFNFGDFNCWVINDGKCPVPEALKGHSSRSNIDSLDTLVLLVQTRSNTILFDTGWGSKSASAPLAGLLTQNLEATGIHRKEIDTIIFSHGHIDHIGGNINSDGKPVFPNARYYMLRKEWEFWISGTNFLDISEDIRQNAILAVNKNLYPLKEKMHLLDDEGEIFPGLSYIETPGHSPGHITIIISSNGKRLLCLFDAFHRPIEIEKPDLFRHPPLTDEAKDSRDKILSQVKPDDLIFGGHFPFPGLGRIICKGNVCRWYPIIID